jgi:hypothetical protein
MQIQKGRPDTVSKHACPKDPYVVVRQNVKVLSGWGGWAGRISSVSIRTVPSLGRTGGRRDPAMIGTVL